MLPNCNSTPSYKRPLKRSFTSSPSHSDIENDSPMLVNEFPKKRRTSDYHRPSTRPSSPTSQKFLTDSVFTTHWNIHSVTEDMFLQWIPKRKRMKYQVCLNKEEMIFSRDDVKVLVAHALEETRRQLDEEFQRVLANKLREQFELLHRVANDNIQRQLELSSHEYII